MSVALHRTAPPLDLIVVEVPPESLVTAAGELDLATAPALTAALRGLASSGGLVTIDLRAVTFLDVAGLHALLEAQRVVRRKDRRLRILGPSGEAARVLDLTGTELVTGR